MIKNYIKIALRNLLRQRVFSFINIFGLALGLMSALLIIIFIQYEYSFDKHFAEGNRIYRVATVLGSYNTPTSPLPLSNSLHDKFQEVEHVTRIFWLEAPHPYFSPNEENDFQETHAFYADSTLFNVFDLELTHGSKTKALVDVNTVIISQSTANRYFGNDSPLNKIIRFNNTKDLRVTGVFRDLPKNTHFDADLFISSESNPLMRDNSAKNWDWLYSSYTYIKLKAGTDSKKIDNELKELFWKETGNTREAYGADYFMYLQPLHAIHLTSHLSGELKTNTDIAVIYTFLSIAIVIVVIASINFMSLSTAQSMRRAREVGMRKVLGGHRKGIILQFLLESISFVFIALSIAAILAALVFPQFNEFIGSDISFLSLFTIENCLIIILVALAIGAAAGFYPALFLSGFIPSQILKGKFSMHLGSIRLRKGLVIVQFSIGFIVLAGTLIVNNQLNYMLTKDLGYTKENILLVELPTDSVAVERLKAEILRLPGVVGVAKMSEPFTNVQGWFNPWYEGAPPQTDLAVTRFHTDEDFISVMSTQLVAGRFFNRNFNGDSTNYVLNEAAISKIGWQLDEAIGKKFGFGEKTGVVIGVVKNFNFRHLSKAVTPFVFFPPTRENIFQKGSLAVRVEGNLTNVLTSIEQKWSELIPAWPLKYSFMDEEISQQYHTEIKLGKLTTVFSGIGMIITAMGLLGLVSFAISQRVKEIGIRKVLGANVKQLVVVTTREFVLLAAMGILTGIPLAYVAMEQWLQSYAFRISINVYPFIIAISISLFISVFTVCSVALRASSANPVDVLKQE